MTKEEIPKMTFAIQRAERAISRTVLGLHPVPSPARKAMHEEAARSALTDAFDVEEMAREAFVADSGQDRDFALRIWFGAREDSPVKKHWRGIATAQRAFLLGGAA